MAAFSTVSARRAFANRAPPPSPPEGQGPQKEKFSPAVREYVQRSFGYENAIAGISEDDIKLRLKEIINHYADRGTIDDVDWASLPLPQDMIQAERKALATGVLLTHKPDSLAATHSSDSPSSLPTDQASSKKRKSSEMSRDVDKNPPNNVNASLAPPWRKDNARNGFEDRLSYPDPPVSKRMEKKQRKLNESAQFKDYSKSPSDLEKRRQRFGDKWKTDDASSGANSRGDTPVDDGPLIGTCQTLEKNYFRLTSAPKPETVRPPSVLEKTLDLLKRRWKKDPNYSYICDQFKSLRQDLTVQRIRTPFTVNVYELHARIALEKGDLGEYNQCQTQLRALYRQRLGGHPAEFLAYRILYMIYTRNRTDMNDVLADLTVADRGQAAVKHALEVRSSLALGNYHKFFKLYLKTPNMGGYLMDMFIDRERLAAVANICKAYKQVDLRFLTEELGFESDRNAAGFLCDHGASELLENKESGVLFACGKASLIFEAAKAKAFHLVDIKGQI